MIAASGLTAADLHAALHATQLGEDAGTGGAGEA